MRRPGRTPWVQPVDVRTCGRRIDPSRIELDGILHIEAAVLQSRDLDRLLVSLVEEPETGRGGARVVARLGELGPGHPVPSGVIHQDLGARRRGHAPLSLGTTGSAINTPRCGIRRLGGELRLRGFPPTWVTGGLLRIRASIGGQATKLPNRVLPRGSLERKGRTTWRYRPGRPPPASTVEPTSGFWIPEDVRPPNAELRGRPGKQCRTGDERPVEQNTLSVLIFPIYLKPRF